MTNKGIILAGGSGTRLYPLTQYISKHLLPIYDNPLIYYSITFLSKIGVTDFFIIVNPRDFSLYRKTVQYLFPKLNIEFGIQENPNGIAEAFLIAEKYGFISEEEDDNIVLILGDNIFYGNRFIEKVNEILHKKTSTIFSKKVLEPKRYGVYDKLHNIIIEKPTTFISNEAIVGLYIYNNKVLSLTKELTPSNRGELEITDLNNLYISNNKINIFSMDNGDEWFDCGTYDSLLDASNFIASIKRRSGEIY
jgi:glucose-1-phosphate thymidylyltransferase